MEGVKPFRFDPPRRSGIATYAKALRRRGDRDFGPGRMRADLVNVALDVDRRLPRSAEVERSRNTADVDVGQQHGTVARRGNRTNAERRPHDLAVDDGGPGVPPFA